MLGGLAGMVGGMKAMSVRDVRVVTGSFVIAFLVTIGSLAVMRGGVLVVIGGLAMVFRCVLVIHWMSSFSGESRVQCDSRCA
jgi:hypothetical protein